MIVHPPPGGGPRCEGFARLGQVLAQDFGAQPGDLNPLGYKDSIGQPAIEGSGVDPLPGQGQPVKAGQFILSYAGEAGVPLPMPRPPWSSCSKSGSTAETL